MNRKKDYLTSLRNIEWRTVETETKIYQVLTYISTNHITELNEVIYKGAVCEKIEVLLKIKTRKKNLRKQAKMIKQRENDGKHAGTKRKSNTRKITIQCEEINQKVLTKKRRLKI